EDWGTATWRYWKKIDNGRPARETFQNRVPVKVRARIVWEYDGTEGVDGVATRLGFDGAIFVDLKDRRGSTGGGWLSSDVVWGPGKRLVPFGSPAGGQGRMEALTQGAGWLVGVG